ncbi:MAG TPA: sulfotransferase [Planctomycetota bacterium]|nr:sulfotransferase [Planctomycetota bacterium]
MEIAHRFIGGSGRSGTTVLFKALSTHPDCFGILEIQIFSVCVFPLLDGTSSEKRCRECLDFCLTDRRKHSDELIASWAQRRTEIDATLFTSGIAEAARIRRLAELVFTVPTVNAGKRTLIEKSPGIVRYAARMKRALPNAKFINIHRDPRDVCASMLTKEWGPKTVHNFCDEYVKGMSEAFRDYTSIGHSDYLVVSLERLIQSPERHIELLWKFFDLPVHDDLVKAAAAMITRDGGNLSRWKSDLSTADAEMINERCGEITRRWMDVTLAAPQ